METLSGAPSMQGYQLSGLKMSTNLSTFHNLKHGSSGLRAYRFASDEITRRPTEKITHSENISGNDI